MNDTFPVTIKHPNGLRRFVLQATPTTTSGECLRALIRRRFLPREGATRRYTLTRASGYALRWGESLGAARVGEHELLWIVVDAPRAFAVSFSPLFRDGAAAGRGELVAGTSPAHSAPAGSSAAELHPDIATLTGP